MKWPYIIGGAIAFPLGAVLIYLALVISWVLVVERGEYTWLVIGSLCGGFIGYVEWCSRETKNGGDDE